MADILKDYGIEPAPERGKRTSWRTFFRAHWECIGAMDFFTVEMWCLRGLVTFYVLLLIELHTRRVHVAGITPSPNTAWMMQIGRNITDPVDGFPEGSRFVIMDRDQKYTDSFRQLLKDAGIEPVRPPSDVFAQSRTSASATSSSSASVPYAVR